MSGRLAWTSNDVSLPQLKTPLSGTYASHIPDHICNDQVVLPFEMSGDGRQSIPSDICADWIDCQI